MKYKVSFNPSNQPKLIITDESTVMVNMEKGGIWRHRSQFPPGTFYTHDKHATSGMVCAGIGPNGFKTKLLRCPKRMNSHTYCDLLIKNGIIEILQNTFPNTFVFQQDGAPCHRSNYTKQTLLSKVPYTIAWPSKSPDLSPIEKLWDYIKNKVRGIFFKTADELFDRLANEWNAIPSELIENYYSSLRARCIVCARYNGESLNGRWGEVHREHDLYRKS